jgi:hypothetical protein
MSSKDPKEPDNAIGIQVVVEQLREELATLVRSRNKQSGIYFELGEIEVELQVGVTVDTTAGGKAKFWVLELGADAKYSKNRTQRIRLKLSPKTGAAPEGAQAGGDGVLQVSE